jgi:hypothetical protein
MLKSGEKVLALNLSCALLDANGMFLSRYGYLLCGYDGTDNPNPSPEY